MLHYLFTSYFNSKALIKIVDSVTHQRDLQCLVPGKHIDEQVTSLITQGSILLCFRTLTHFSDCFNLLCGKLLNCLH